MKKMLLFTVLFASGLSLNADLLNGPWSPESQEIIKLIENPLLPIPEKFKSGKLYGFTQKEIFVNSFRECTQRNRCYWMDFLGIDDLASLEAAITIIKKFKPQEKVIATENIDPLDYSNFFILFMSIELLNDTYHPMDDLFKKVFIQIKPQTQLAVLKMFFDGFIFTRPGNPLATKKEELIQFIAPLVTPEIFNKSFIYAIEKGAVGLFDSETAQMVNFLISRGAKINFEIVENNKKVTIMDLLNNKLLQMEAQDLRQNIQEWINFLKSKGAKTYAELTVTEKGQK